VNVSRPSSPRKKKPQSAYKKRSKQKKQHWLSVALGLLGVAAVSATAGALFAVGLTSTPLMQRKFDAADASVFSKGDRISSSNLQMPELTRPVNILVLGTKVLSSDLDDPPPELKNLGYHALVNSFDGLTDTMLLLRFSPDTKKLVVLSIPRDTRIEIPGRGISKINAANAQGGPALSARSVSHLLGGVGIDRYVTINVQGVQALVEALGGVTVYVPKDMKYQDDSQHLYINLKAGKQHLNGEQTLQLLRFRYDRYGDIGRIQRQQMVMRAIMEQALKPSIIGRLPKILSVVQSHVDTNLSVEELVALVGFATQVQRNDVQMLTIPGNFGDIKQYKTSYWLPSHSRIQNMMAQYFDFGRANQPEETSGVRIAIQDSTRQLGSVEFLLERLHSAGFSRINTDDVLQEPIKITRIIAQQGDEAAARQVRQALGFGEIRVDSTGILDSDITIQLGQDWKQKQ
jgi:LCP family protein required for cell wall assembly